jgi:2,3-dihydroxybiphenyl 1,2-dioxygenase
MNESLTLGYLGLEVADPAAFDHYLGDVVGLVAGDRAPTGASTWRNDHKAQRIIVHEGPANDASYIGLEATSPEAFNAAVARLRAHGTDVVAGTAAEKAARRVDDLVWTTAPWGVRVEVAVGLADAVAPFESPLVPGGFLTEGVGFGHVVFATFTEDSFAAADRFATEALGFRQSDWIETDLGGLPLVVRFYHCNQRHHTLALAYIPVELPQRLHHVMVETVNADNVGLAFDRAWNAGHPIANALGKHDNDQMFSFYAVTPAGFQLEFGYGARTIAEPWNDDRRYKHISAWGHQPLASPLHA